jgi:signal transduction histidine kinase
MPLSFRQRIFLVLAALTAVPTFLAIIGWALAVRADAPSSGARASFDRVAASARQVLERVDTARLEPEQRAAVRHHLAEISSSVTLARRAETYFRYYTAGFVVVVLVLGAMVLYAAVRVAGHLSRQLSRPIDELVGWTRLIRRRLPLPAGHPSRGAPEFDALRQALRELVAAMEAAREHELESERWRAFREVARRVAHEIKNPLTSMRIAVDQLGRGGGQTGERMTMAVEVLAAETERLDRMAREFADFGRLPEGAQSDVDLVELLEELGRTAVPDGVHVVVRGNGGRRGIMGYYDPLRRAFSNLLRNASEAMHGEGQIDVGVTGDGAGDGGGLVVIVADHGPGIPEVERQRVFEPYFTTKTDGTGLGLALVRQTLEAHRATIGIEETPGGGATFTIVFPG